MALHGEIKANGVVLAYWEAVRHGALRGPEEVYTYSWTYLRSHASQAGPERASGLLEHRYSDGETMLALLVIAEALSTINSEQYLSRYSIPGRACVHCGTVMAASLRCAGCEHVDPLTRTVRPPDTESKDSPASEEV